MQKGSATFSSHERGSVQLLLVFVVVVVLAGGVYFKREELILSNFGSKGDFEQNPTETPKKQPEFNDYSNGALGFEFTLPKELAAEEDSEDKFNERGNGNYRKNFEGYVGYGPGKFAGAVAVLDKDKSFDKSPLSVWVFDNPGGFTPEEWFNKYWYYPFLWGVFDDASKGHITPDKEATVSGAPVKYKVVDYQPGTPKYFYVSKGKRMYLFRVIGEAGEKILSSVNLSL